MARSLLLRVFALVTFLFSCSNNHLIEERQYRKVILKDYKERHNQYAQSRSDLFLSADTLNVPQHEAMMFLLAYSPLNDIASCSPEFLLANVDAALKTRKETKWGQGVPYEVFLHFVLPPRVNNENLDSFRLVYFNELATLIDGLGAKEAALEINHWCHEKVTYQPSDIRTSAPMATILSARGRCGEESTFTTAALRTAGLPARQVYTPRWAHSDDNHAWVEVWIDGEWYYMGACEPEPILDRGWFTEPARRAMLVHTKAFGRYNGPEPLLRKGGLYSEINVLAKYAVTRELYVTVKTDDGEPVAEADVDYLLYNYAELYPITSLKTNRNGNSTFATGKGNLVVWASKGNLYGFTNVTPDNDTVDVIISELHNYYKQQLDLFAPVAGKPLPGPSEELIAENAIRLREEDRLRQAYIDSWMNEIQVGKVADETKLDPERLDKIFKTSMGNRRNILAFLYKSEDRADMALRLLENVSEKDLRDTPADVLLDHLLLTSENIGSLNRPIFDAYVLSPRIDNELLTPFRSRLRNIIPADRMEQFSHDALSVVSWIDSSIIINEAENYYGTPVTPEGVARLKIADTHSRDIFFVALCRTAGQPARLDPVTGRPQFYKEGTWHFAWFRGMEEPSSERSYITFISDETNPKPEYHIHFTLARFDHGKYRTLEFGENVMINNMPENIPLDPGRFMLVTGNRDENGNVLAELQFFELMPDDSLQLMIHLRHKSVTTSVLGKIDLTREFTSVDNKRLILSEISKNGAVISWIEPDKEPTKHFIRDLPLLSEELNKSDISFVFMLDHKTTTDAFRPDEMEGLPQKSWFVWDNDHSFLGSALHSDHQEVLFPVVISVDNKGDILFTSEGYRIGIGEQILKSIK